MSIGNILEKQISIMDVNRDWTQANNVKLTSGAILLQKEPEH